MQTPIAERSQNLRYSIIGHSIAKKNFWVLLFCAKDSNFEKLFKEGRSLGGSGFVGEWKKKKKRVISRDTWQAREYWGLGVH